ncbi:MAG: hypothetical protein BGO95_08995 [Micrococcales bacterium 73-13]|nr:MAG: hypothetical protein BGO95_08995 [Micrococcales bacterium 73-13]
MSSVLIVVGLALVVLAGAVHVLIFLLESVLWRSRSTWRQFGIASAADAEIARPWALNQGFYNLFLAVGAIAGGIGGIVAGVDPVAGLSAWGWVGGFCALCMLAAAIVLLVSSRRRLLRGALIQGAVPLLAVALLGVGLAV